MISGITWNLESSDFIQWFPTFFRSGVNFIKRKKMILTSKLRAEHRFAGQNTQQTPDETFGALLAPRQELETTEVPWYVQKLEQFSAFI